MRNFNFIGFQPVSSDQMPSIGLTRQSSGAAHKYHFMIYELDAETDDDDEDQ